MNRIDHPDEKFKKWIRKDGVMTPTEEISTTNPFHSSRSITCHDVMHNDVLIRIFIDHSDIDVGWEDV
jgi:hypothetical protein